MPSNKELGFDPKWNEQQRIEWYRRKLEELANFSDEMDKTFPPPTDEIMDDCSVIDISDHPLVKIFEHHHKDNYPMYVDSDGTLDSPGLLEIVDLCMKGEVEVLFNKLIKEE